MGGEEAEKKYGIPWGTPYLKNLYGTYSRTSHFVAFGGRGMTVNAKAFSGDGNQSIHSYTFFARAMHSLVLNVVFLVGLG